MKKIKVTFLDKIMGLMWIIGFLWVFFTCCYEVYKLFEFLFN